MYFNLSILALTDATTVFGKRLPKNTLASFVYYRVRGEQPERRGNYTHDPRAPVCSPRVAGWGGHLPPVSSLRPGAGLP